MFETWIFGLRAEHQLSLPSALAVTVKSLGPEQKFSYPQIVALGYKLPNLIWSKNMKHFILVMGLAMVSSNYAMADILCNIYSDGVDQAESITLYESGGCFRSNGYHHGEYHSELSQENGTSTYLCTNKHQNSWYSPKMKIVVRNEEASVLELTQMGWVPGPEIRCK